MGAATVLAAIVTMDQVASERREERKRKADLRQLARGSAFNLAGSMVAAVLNLALPVIITRGLAKEDAGIFFQATVLFTILINVGTIGADTGVLRSLPRAIALERVDRIPRYLRTGVSLPVLFTLAMSALGIALAGPIAQWATNSDGDPARQFEVALWILLPLLPVAVGYIILVAASRGLGSVRPLVMVEKLGRGSVQVAAVWGASLASSLSLILVAWVLPYVAALIVIALWVRSMYLRLRAKHPRSDDVTVDEGKLRKDFWSFAAPRALSRVFSVALQRFDIILVGAILGPAQAAIYAAATRFLILGLMFVQAIQQVMAPNISQLLATHDDDRANQLYRTTTTWLTLVSWPIYLLAAWYAPMLLDVFGEGYDSGSTTVEILCLFMLIATVCGPVDSVLLMGGRSVLSLINTGLALLVSVVLDVILVPRLGIEGAAMGWSVGILVNNLLPLWQVNRTMGMHPFGPGVRTAMSVCVVTFGLIPGFVYAALGQSLLSLLLALLLASAAFLLAVTRLRAPLEVDDLVRALRRRRPVNGR